MTAKATGLDNLVLLTGLPRSGSTLCCKLLNQYQDTLALVEPIPISYWEGITKIDEVIGKIQQFSSFAFEDAYQGYAISKIKDGQLADNIIEDKRSGSGELRRVQTELGRVPLGTPLTDSGRLIIKHNAFFAALLPELAKHFDVYALVRNPLSVLASWQTVDLPVNRGRLPAGEKLSRVLSAQLNKEPSNLERQVAIIDWFFKQYATLPKEKIIFYEQLMSGDLSSLERISGKVLAEAGREKSKNQYTSYDKDMMVKLGEKLVQASGEYTGFYSRQDIEDLMR